MTFPGGNGMGLAASRLAELLNNAGIPIHGVTTPDGLLLINYRDEATAQQRADGAAIQAAFVPTAPTPREQALELARIAALLEMNNFQTTFDNVTTNYPSGVTLTALNLKQAADHQMVLALARIVRWLVLRRGGIPESTE
jgi:hypothetical protein